MLTTAIEDKNSDDVEEKTGVHHTEAISTFELLQLYFKKPDKTCPAKLK